ncbi:MAG: VWA domain-containing protein [Deltaproteobacteria bacterium]|nr:VWA domain-containing protein [Deltaproteobacteria bacterium]
MSGPGLLAPWGLAALSSLAVVGVIYLFYQRYRKRSITGLFLWQAPKGWHEGGRKLSVLRLSRSLLLDLLACLLLSLAVAAPAWIARTGRTVVLVLDGSLSMRARDNHDKARDAARRTVASAGHASDWIVIEAGDVPRVLAGLGGDEGTLDKALDAYDPFESSDSLDEAVRLARELVTGHAEIHVFTDRDTGLKPPAASTLTAHVLAGRAPNLAIVDAVRHAGGTVSVAVASFSASAQKAKLEVRDGSLVIHDEGLELEPGAVAQVTLLLPPGTGALDVRLVSKRDAIAQDSRALLLPEPPGTVTFGLDVQDDSMLRALDAAGAVPADGAPDLLVTDAPDARGTVATLVLSVPGEEASTLLGPFVVDMAHPLCRDLDLTGVYWTTQVEGRLAPGSVPLVSVGDQLLYSIAPDGALVLDLDPTRSNITRTAAWPVLVANLVRHVSGNLPGLRRANYRPGEVPVFVRHADDRRNPESVEGEGLELEWERHAPPPRLPSRPGRYRVVSADGTGSELAVNAIAPAESDLRQLASRAGKHARGVTGVSAGAARLHPLAWLLAALALAAAALNWLLDRRKG